jgi:dTDP-4-amino-4,6-dideoxygalactose transaminase
MRVPYNYLPDQFADPEPILASIKELVMSTKFTLGSVLGEFEAEFAEIIGTKHAVGVGSGSDALFLSLKALGIGAGDEVITMTSTFVATVGAIVATGARPVLVDVTEERTIDAGKIEAAISERTKALLPVHWAGTAADMPEIMEIAGKHGLSVVEDSCQAIGASVDGKTVGTFGDAGGFSLHPLKNLNVWGDGGMIVTNSDDMAAKLRLLRNHGLSDRDTVEVYGYNSRLDALHAVVGRHVIKDYHSITKKRIANAARLDAGLQGLVDIPPRHAAKRYVYHLYIVEADNRNGLLSFLNDAGIDAKVHYPVPLHLQPASAKLGLEYRAGDFPVAEAQAKRILTLPAHQHLSDEQIDYMVDKVREFCSR